MLRTLSLALITLVVTSLPAFAANDGSVHSGLVVEVKNGGRVLVLEEMGPWHGPNTGLVKRTISLAPGVAAHLIRPTGEWSADAAPGYDAKPIDVTDVKPGDFVNVLLGGPDRMATALEVVQPDDAGLASPKN